MPISSDESRSLAPGAMPAGWQQPRLTGGDEPPLQSGSAATWTTTAPRLRNTLQQVAIRQRESAAILRAHGRHSEAQRAERSASRIDLTLDQPKAVQRMRTMTERFADAPNVQSLLQRAVEGALALTGADLGNIQIADAHGHLRIVAQHGFDGEFMEHFAGVDDETSACGRAAIHRRQEVIVDVTADSGFAPHRAIASACGFRAVQSTPLIDRSGRLRGVMSTHFRRSGRPADRELQIIDWYAEHLAAALPVPIIKPIGLYESAAVVHEQTADLQDRSSSLVWTRGIAGNDPGAVQLGRWASRARDRAVLARERARARPITAGERPGADRAGRSPAADANRRVDPAAPEPPVTA